MFRKHYENANNNLVPSQSLINDTKRKMYDRLSDLEFSDTPVSIETMDYASNSDSEVIRINSELKTTSHRTVSRSLKVACSVAACAAIITSSALGGKYLLSNKTTVPQASFVATQSPTASAAPFSLSDYAGKYYCSCGKDNYSFITLSAPTDKSITFTYSSVDGEASMTEKGTATLNVDNTLSYVDKDGCEVAVSFENSCLFLSSISGSTPNHFNVEGQYRNIDGKNKYYDKNKFNTPDYFVSGHTYKFDINNDGKAEAIQYNKGILTVDGKQVNNGSYSEGLRTDGFYLADIDFSDNEVNLLLQDEGPSYDPVISVITYKADGTITEAQVGSDIDSASTSFDNNGNIYGLLRLSLLQTWYADCSWKLSKGKIKLEEKDLYAGVDPRLYSDGATQPSLKKNITLYQDRKLSSKTLTMKPQKVEFTLTDNKNWVKVVGLKDKTEGWLYLEDFNIIPSTKEEATEYFDNLWLAD